MSDRIDGDSSYLRRLSQGIGEAWNRFWFTPVDPFSLCALRVFVGLAGLAYLASHSADLVRWFGRYGLLPIDTVQRFTGAAAGGAVEQQVVFRPSYFYLTEDSGMLWLFHVLGMLVLLAFTAGFATRITSILSAIVVLSYVHRAPMITGQVEPVLTMLLLYLCLAPAGAYLSVDHWLGWGRKSPPGGSLDEPEARKSWTANLSLRLIQVHLVGFYLLMGLSKLGGETWWNGSAVWWLAARTEARLLDFSFLHQYAFLYNAWTHAIVLFELLFAVLIWKKLARPLLIVLSAAMWSSLALLTGLVGFCALMVIANLAFVSSETLRRACSKFGGSVVESAAGADSAPAGKKPAAVS